METSDLARKVRELPHKPGVYLYKDRFGKIIYVGKARDLKKRVSQYFHPARQLQADVKTRALINSVCDLEYHVVKSEPEALLFEGRLIKEYRPRYNISFRDDKQFPMVKINLNEPFPRFQLTRIKSDDDCRYFGPFPYSTALKQTLELIKKKFHLRSCHPTVPSENDFKHCLDHIIRSCSAPCMLRINREAYMEQVLKACAFLEGKSAEGLAELEQEMQEAAESMNFEKAARLRDMLDSLRKTTKPQKRFLQQLPTTVIPEKDLETLRDALKLNSVPQFIECFDISNISDTLKVSSMVSFKNGKANRSDYRRYRIKTVEGQDDFASMAETISRRYSRVLKEARKMPDLIVVDGGKGQLSAAFRELKVLGLENQPIIGLAKQREEIFFPNQSEPLVLPHESGAIRLLQRIRDEAHRTANGYHRLLMRKRVSESILDECPGIGTTRKRLLLQKFGSTAAIRKATLEELSAVVPLSLAEKIVAFLKKEGSPSPSKEEPFVYKLKQT